ncbi:hypothetical protein PVK06_033794 [Gossypium arboreum]|uniref:Uncharacterized protein n=1 Tax=Gossypium arboreum TaxID=29729 RepID=A0ABR0NEK1_GOSAR|nr:hypothetical protein PVK06_033794 [Gossypium arboreum]
MYKNRLSKRLENNPSLQSSDHRATITLVTGDAPRCAPLALLFMLIGDIFLKAERQGLNPPFLLDHAERRRKLRRRGHEADLVRRTKVNETYMAALVQRGNGGPNLGGRACRGRTWRRNTLSC